jgi:excisionase family DNA binding protein
VIEPLAPLNSAPAVADYLGVSVPTVYRLLRNRKLQGVKVGGQWRISDEAVRRFLEVGIVVSSASKARK